MRAHSPKTPGIIALAVTAGAVLLFAGLSARFVQAPRAEAPVATANAPSPATTDPPSPAGQGWSAETRPDRAASPAGPSAAPGTAGMIIGIDPETGKLGMPSREARERLLQSPALDRSETGLTVVTRPDGSKHIDLQGRFQEYTVLRLAPDGRRLESCVQGPDLEAALQAEPAASPSPRHEER